MLSVKSYVAILPVLIVRAFSPFAPALLSATPLVSSDRNWQHDISNPWARGKSPQVSFLIDSKMGAPPELRGLNTIRSSLFGFSEVSLIGAAV